MPTRLLLVSVLLLSLAAPAGATGGVQDAPVPQSGGEARAGEGPVRPHPEAERAISRLRSPYCPGLMLEVCPSESADLLRDTIQMRAAEGWEADSIVEWVLANHGEEWRAVPRTEGSGLWAWLAPPAFLLLGLGLVLVALRRLRGPFVAAGAGAPRPEVSDEDRERLRSAIREMEEREEAGL